MSPILWLAYNLCIVNAAGCSFFFCNLFNIPFCHFCICLSLCSSFPASGISLTASLCVFNPLLVSRWPSLSFFRAPPPRLSEKEIQLECLFDGEMGSVVSVHFSCFVSLRVISPSGLPSDFVRLVVFRCLLLRPPQHLCICFCHNYHGNHFTSWWTHMPKFIG